MKHLSLIVLLVAGSALAGDAFAGRFEAEGIPGALLELARSESGGYAGSLAMGPLSVQLEGRVDGATLRGTMLQQGQRFEFTARKNADGSLTVTEPGGAQVRFVRQGAAVADAAIVINGRALTAQEVEGLRTLRVQPHPGRYWYDPSCGAWGMEGGPTIGFLYPNLPTAPMAPDASNGNTGVYVNGRNLPMQDLVALQALTGPLVRGRYFVDGQGNAGVEGGPVLINLVQAAQRAGGGDNGWSSPITGASGNSSGGSGYVILKSPTGRPTTVGY